MTFTLRSFSVAAGGGARDAACEAQEATQKARSGEVPEAKREVRQAATIPRRYSK